MGIQNTLQRNRLQTFRILGYKTRNIGCSDPRDNKENAKDPEKRNCESGGDNEAIF